jgi:rhamnose transport system ATP-binding protein
VAADYLLELQGIRKYFPGVRALDGVDFHLRPGEVHALIGENGAGKSTLVKVLTGVYRPDGGEILLEGKRVEFPSPVDSQQAGIAAIHQEATMFPELSVTENIFMGHHLRTPGSRLLRWKEMRDRTRELLERLEVDIDPDTLVKNLTIAQRHIIEIAKALSFEARIVIMDEPTSALSLREVQDLWAIIRQLKSEGRAVVFISHKFEEIYEIADAFTVLRDGRFIGEGLVRDADVDAIIAMMVGRSLDQRYAKVEVELGPVILEVQRLASVGEFREVSFELHRGEILGIFGLIGSGRTELMQALFGITQPTGGNVAIDGKRVHIRSPRDALAHGFAFVPEDRQQQGVILKMNIRENITLPIVRRLSHFDFLDRGNELEVTETYGRRLDVRAAGWEQPVESLSGGNQQKVVLGKWLATRPRILILDEPTRGIDVGTKVEVHKFMGELAGQGIGIIMVSSEMLEILGISDTILVMHEGLVTARFTRAEATAEKVLKAAVGGGAA